ncbi:hypothetical protein HETIRDRAFT_430865 [Heterobasidion irregulare TC 32-1]|uniref:Uncharacterized protein n=1 Tax=Heterobasidion irregulare (strain TC 32-1) TaxID=747525 RepID=W4JRQ0_HETIT|nr:uncharacterized protein HETIRDRAFT_430865 [Heterobasidion irregulare TC 32-1]ETW75551.1 hypothetical protein HETIRDRAFT_430865 [Heterobasidion irregulare TC 32-1]
MPTPPARPHDSSSRLPSYFPSSSSSSATLPHPSVTRPSPPRAPPAQPRPSPDPKPTKWTNSAASSATWAGGSAAREVGTGVGERARGPSLSSGVTCDLRGRQIAHLRVGRRTHAHTRSRAGQGAPRMRTTSGARAEPAVESSSRKSERRTPNALERGGRARRSAHALWSLSVRRTSSCRKQGIGTRSGASLPVPRVGHQVLWRAHDHGDAVHFYVSRASADVDIRTRRRAGWWMKDGVVRACVDDPQHQHQRPESSPSDRYIEGALLHDAPARTRGACARARGELDKGGSTSSLLPQSQSHRIRVCGAHVGRAAVFLGTTLALHRTRGRNSFFILF